MSLLRFALPLVAATLLTAPLAAQPASRVVAVLGEARIEIAPDQVFVTAGVFNQGKNAREAMDANKRNMADILKVLRESGVAETDMRTAAIAVQPVLTNPGKDARDGERPRVVGYAVSNRITVRLAEPAKVGELLDRLVAAGANQIYDVRFAIADEAKRRDAVRADAIRDARRKAELYAQAAGAKVGRVVAISEIEVPGAATNVLALRSGADAGVPVLPGLQSLSTQLAVTWELEN